MQRRFWTLLLLCAGVEAQAGSSSPRDLCGLLPAGTPVVVEMFDASSFWQQLRAWAEPLPADLPQSLTRGLPWIGFLTRLYTGQSVDELLQTLGPAQVVLALVPHQDRLEAVLLSRIHDAEKAGLLLDRFAAKVPHQLHDGVWCVSREPALLGLVKGRPQSSLLDEPGFRAGRAAPSPGLRLHLDLAALRARAGARRAAFDDLDAGGRFFLGPVVEVADRAARVTATLRITEHELELRAVADAGLAPEDRGRLVVAQGRARSLPTPPPGALLALSLDRSIQGLLAHADRVLKEDDAAQTKAFLGIADAFVTGSFTEEFLASFEEPLHFYVLSQEPAGDAPAPRLQLPSFVWAARIQRPGVESMLRKAWFAVATVQGVERMQRGQPPFRATTITEAEGRFSVLEPPEWTGEGEPPVEFGLQPAMLVADGWLILSSTIDGARRMAASIAGGRRTEVDGDWLQLHGAAAAGYLRRNEQPLALDRVLREGGELRAAREELAAVAALLGAVDAQASLRATGQPELVVRVRRKR